MPRPFWISEAESAQEAYTARLVDLAREVGPAEVLDWALGEEGGECYSRVRRALVDDGWTVRAGTWAHPHYQVASPLPRPRLLDSTKAAA